MLIERQKRMSRVRFKHPIRVVTLEGQPRVIRTLTANVSRQGLFLRMPEPLPMGTKVALSLEAGGRALALAQAEVVWGRTQPSQIPGRFPGCGVRFTEFMHPRAQELVQYLVHNLDRGKPLTLAPPERKWMRFLPHAGIGALAVCALLAGLVLWTPSAPEPLEEEPSAVALEMGTPTVSLSPGGERGDSPASARTAAPQAPLVGAEPEPGPAVANAEPVAVDTTTTLEPEPATPEPVAAKPELAAKPESVAAKTEPVAAKPEPAVAKPEPVVAKPEPVVAKPEPVAAKPEPVAAKPEPVAAKPGPVAAKPEPVAAMPEPSAAKPAPVIARSEPVVTKPAKKPAASGQQGTVSLPSGAAASLKWTLTGTELRLALELAPGAQVTKAFVLTGPARAVFDVSGAAPSRSHQVAAAPPYSTAVRLGKPGSGTRIVVDLDGAPKRSRQDGDALVLSF